MEGVKAFLNRRFAGAPIWVWAIVAAIVLFVGYRYYKSKSSGGTGGGSQLDNSTGSDTGSAGVPPDVSSPGGISEPPIDTSGTVGSIPEQQFLSDLASTIQDAIGQNPPTQIVNGGSPTEPTDGSSPSLPGGTNVKLPGKKPKSKPPVVKKKAKTTPKKPHSGGTLPKAKPHAKPPVHKPKPSKPTPHAVKKPPPKPPEEPHKVVKKKR